MEYLVWYLHFHDMIVFLLWDALRLKVIAGLHHKFAPFHPVSPRLARSSYIQYISGQSIRSVHLNLFWWQFSGSRVTASSKLNLPGAQACWWDDCPGMGLDWLGRCWVDSMFHPCPKNWHPCLKKWHPCPKNWHPLYSGWKAIESPYLIEKPLKSREHTCMDMYRYSLVIPVLDFFLLPGLCQNLLRANVPKQIWP